MLDGERGVDFRTVVHGLALGRRHLDPDDPNAYRLPSGSVVTSDKREAEIALAPVEVGAGFAARAARRAGREGTALARQLPAGLRLRGYSTHISVEVPEDLTVEAAKLYVTRFGPAMVLAMDGPEAPGLRVRPRYRRLELCGDYVEGRRLRAALEYAAGSVAACVTALVEGPVRSSGALPPPVAAKVRPAIERPGWFIDQACFGIAPGQPFGKTVRLADGKPVTAADHVSIAWAAARRGLATWIAAFEPAGRDAERPLASRRGASTDSGIQLTPFGDVLKVRSRPGFDLAPVMVTWPLTVFMAADSAAKRSAFVAVPREWLVPFLRSLDRGDLDSPLRRYVAARRGRARAVSWHDVQQPGLFDNVPSRLGLLPPEPM